MAEVFVEASHEQISTLDEPVKDTLLRDLKAIGRKMVVVVYPPFGDDRELREWDLWGPLLLCLLLAIILAVKAGQDQKALVFSAVFLWVWLGAAVVTLNAKFLGSTISFFQTVCVMGYCLTPLFLGALLVLVIPIFFINLVIVMATMGVVLLGIPALLSWFYRASERNVSSLSCRALLLLWRLDDIGGFVGQLVSAFTLF
ncbi:terbinafine resistance locus protein (yip1) [Angomonas deanei]|nr:terbinafine resistance locus protein (yip1) [Angomonas deanei]|eukprot:EPY43772.1 terbinafine resistance locus protein (yip1) [Angomonas deanei]